MALDEEGLLLVTSGRSVINLLYSGNSHDDFTQDQARFRKHVRPNGGQVGRDHIGAIIARARSKTISCRRSQTQPYPRPGIQETYDLCLGAVELVSLWRGKGSGENSKINFT